MTKRRSHILKSVHVFGTFGAVSAILLATPARGDVTFSPSFDLRQIVSDSSNRSARGWLEAGARFNLEMDTQRLDGNIAYRYARRFKEFGDLSRKDRHNANANVSAQLIDDFLLLRAGGVATQYVTDPRGFTSLNNDADTGNQTQIFSGYVEPSIRQRLGGFAEVSAHYRLGATSASGPRVNRLRSGGEIGLDPTDGIGSLLSDSVTHSGGVSVASARGTNTINWSLSSSMTREDVDQLNQKYRGYSVGGELGYEVTQKLELLGSAGYEDIENKQDSIRFDPITGLPVLDADNNFQIDPLNPRRTAFAFSGVYWNAGFRYAPSRRTTLELRAGERYGQVNFYGDFRFQARSGMTVRANFAQTLNSFSRLLTIFEDGVPIGGSRLRGIDRFGIPFCVDGIDPDSREGECLTGLTQAVTPATFRLDRGIISVTRQLEALSLTASLFYDKRRYVDDQQLQAPGVPRFTPSQLGADESVGARGRVGLRLGEKARLNFDTLVSYNVYALSRDRKDTAFTLGTNYSRKLGQRLNVNASLYGTQRISNNRRDSNRLTASVGLGYRF